MLGFVFVAIIASGSEIHSVSTYPVKDIVKTTFAGLSNLYIYGEFTEPSESYQVLLASRECYIFYFESSKIECLIPAYEAQNKVLFLLRVLENSVDIPFRGSASTTLTYSPYIYPFIHIAPSEAAPGDRIELMGVEDRETPTSFFKEVSVAEVVAEGLTCCTGSYYPYKIEVELGSNVHGDLGPLILMDEQYEFGHIKWTAVNQTPDGDEFFFRTIGVVESISISEGSSCGNDELEIRGKGFPEDLERVSIEIDGIDCTVRSASYQKLTCITSANPNKTEREVYHGSAGVVRKLWKESYHEDFDQGIAPDYVTQIANSRVPQLWSSEKHQQVLYGLFKAPRTGSYKFHSSSDDKVIVYISTDETKTNKRKVLEKGCCTGVLIDLTSEEITESTQVSLQENEFYYIEIYHENSGGGPEYFEVSFEVLNTESSRKRKLPVTQVLTNYSELDKAKPFTYRNEAQQVNYGNTSYTFQASEAVGRSYFNVYGLEYNGLRVKLPSYMYNKDTDLLRFNLNNGSSTTGTVYSHPSSSEYWPVITSELLRTYETTPQLRVWIDNRLTLCRSDCTFVYREPTITQVSIYSNEVEVKGEFLPTENSKVQVKLGSNECKVLSSTRTKLLCSLSEFQKGTYTLEIHVTDYGIISSQFQVELSCPLNCEVCSSLEDCSGCEEGYYLVQGVCTPKCPTNFDCSPSSSSITTSLIFNLQLSVICDIVEDKANSIPVLTGKDNKFYPDYDITDPLPAKDRGFYFTGSSYMLLPPYLDTSYPLVYLAPEFTISIWIKDQYDECAILAKQDNALRNILEVGFSDELVHLDINTYKVQSQVFDLVNDRGWKFLVVKSELESYDDTSINFFLNNTLKSSSKLESTYLQDSSIEYFFTIGARKGDSGTFSGFFTGFIWEIRIYNSVVDHLELALTSDCNGCSLCPIENNQKCLSDCDIDQFWDREQCLECSSECQRLGCVRQDKECNLCPQEECSSCNEFSSCLECTEVAEFNGDGECQCKPISAWNKTSRTCQCEIGAAWDPPLQQCQCKEKSHWGETLNQCVCEVGATWNSALEECECKERSYWDSTSEACECEVGAVWNSALEECECKEKSTWDSTSEACECEVGVVWNQNLEQCECKSISFWNETLNQCVCQTGAVWNLELEECQCKEKSYSNETLNQCMCETGATWNSELEQCECKEKSYWNSTSEACECEIRSVWDEKSEQCNCLVGALWNSELQECQCKEKSTWNGKNCECKPMSIWNSGSEQCNCKGESYWTMEECTCGHNKELIEDKCMECLNYYQKQEVTAHYFSEYKVIVVNFAGELNTTNSPSCSKTFLPETLELLGDSPTCSWKSSYELEVALGSNSNVTFVQINKLYVLKSQGECNYDYEQFETEVQEKDPGAKIRANILGPTLLSRDCEAKYLADASVPLSELEVEWEVATPDIAHYYSPELALDPSSLEGNSSITLKIENSRGSRDSFTIHPQVSDKVCYLAIQGGNRVVTKSGNSINLSARIQESCGLEPTNPTWSWESDSLYLSRTNRPNLNIGASDLEPNTTYSLKASFSSSECKGSSEVEILVLDSPLVVVIDRLNGTAPMSNPLKISATDSYDPDDPNAEFSYYWQSSEGLVNSSLSTPTLVIDSEKLIPNKYYEFSCLVENTRNSKRGFSSVGLYLRDNISTKIYLGQSTRVSAGTWNIIVPQVESSEELEFKWNGQEFRSFPVLTVEPDTLTPGQTYKYTLQTKELGSGQVFENYVTVESNQEPACNRDLEAELLIDKLKLAIKECYDPEQDYPLKFVFGVVSEDLEITHSSVLDREIELLIPSNTSSAFVKVCDQLNTCTTYKSSIQINSRKLQVAEASQLYTNFTKNKEDVPYVIKVLSKNELSQDLVSRMWRDLVDWKDSITLSDLEVTDFLSTLNSIAEVLDPDQVVEELLKLTESHELKETQYYEVLEIAQKVLSNQTLVKTNKLLKSSTFNLLKHYLPGQLNITYKGQNFHIRSKKVWGNLTDSIVHFESDLPNKSIFTFLLITYKNLRNNSDIVEVSVGQNGTVSSNQLKMSNYTEFPSRANISVTHSIEEPECVVYSSGNWTVQDCQVLSSQSVRISTPAFFYLKPKQVLLPSQDSDFNGGPYYLTAAYLLLCIGSIFTLSKLESPSSLYEAEARKISSKKLMLLNHSFLGLLFYRRDFSRKNRILTLTVALVLENLSNGLVLSLFENTSMSEVPSFKGKFVMYGMPGILLSFFVNLLLTCFLSRSPENGTIRLVFGWFLGFVFVSTSIVFTAFLVQNNCGDWNMVWLVISLISLCIDIVILQTILMLFKFYRSTVLI